MNKNLSKISDPVLRHDYEIIIEGFEQLNMVESYNLSLDVFKCRFVVTDSTIKSIFELANSKKLLIALKYFNQAGDTIHTVNIKGIPRNLEIDGDIRSKGLVGTTLTYANFVCDVLRD